MRSRSLLIAAMAMGVVGAAVFYYLRPLLELEPRRPRRRPAAQPWHPAATEEWTPVPTDDRDIVTGVEAHVSTPRPGGLDVRASGEAAEDAGVFRRPVAGPLPRRRRPSGMTLVVAAALIALVALGLGSWAIVDATRESDSSTDTATAQNAEALALLGNPSKLTIPVSGSAKLGAILVVGQNGDAFLVLTRLAEAPEGKTYEAWVIPKGAKPAAAGLFTGTERVISLGRRVDPGATVAITLERPEGAAAPTQAPKLFAQRPSG
jgi:anti-sigma-K factor RskA